MDIDAGAIGMTDPAVPGPVRRAAARNQIRGSGFEREPIQVPDGKGGRTTVDKDESPRRDGSLERLAAPGTVRGAKTITPGNAPGLNDGAATVVVASAARRVMTLIDGLRARGGGIGACAICGGFGQGDAVLVEVGD